MLPAPIQRVRGHLHDVRRLLGEVRDAVSRLDARIATAEAVMQLDARVAALESELKSQAATAEAMHRQLVELLRFVLADEPRRRACLRELRQTPEYELSYSEADPLVSVVIPTYDSYETLGRRAIPSVLAQTYQNLEIIVVGDAAPEESRAVVESFGDSRLSFFNLPYRGPYPPDPQRLWLVAGASPFNEAVFRACGRWIALLDDDDAYRPDHIERLLHTARAGRHELTYARFESWRPDGTSFVIGRFPPEDGYFAMQAAMWHAGLSEVFQYELADGVLGLPTDWALCLRMMEVGVRIGFVDHVTVDVFPSKAFRTSVYGNEPWRPASVSAEHVDELTAER